MTSDMEQSVRIPVEHAAIEGNLRIARNAVGLVTFAHGSGSSRHSTRNRYVASVLARSGIATLLVDLLTAAEEQAERFTRHHRFDIELLANRLVAASEWLRGQALTRGLPQGYFGASTGAAAALVAAARRPGVDAIVSRGGRPDLAGNVLGRVQAPTLLIVGGADHEVLQLNREAFAQLVSVKKLEIVPGATHLFQEEGTLERVAELATAWFVRHLAAAHRPSAQSAR